MADEADKSGETPVVIDTIEALIEQLKTDNPALATELEELIEKGAQFIVLSDQKDEVDKLLAASTLKVSEYELELVEAEKLISGQNETIGDLTAQLDKLQTSPSSVPVITVNKVVYEVHTQSFQFMKDGEQPRTYTLAELLKDKKLQAVLVEKGMGFLIEKV